MKNAVYYCYKPKRSECSVLVTAIVSQKHDNSKQNIFIDNVFAFALVSQDVAYFKLKEGCEISQEQYEFIQNNLIYIKAQDTALYYLGYKMRTEAEVRKKLTEKEFSEDVIEKVMAFLAKYHYCDDKEYAIKFVKERLRLHPKGVYGLKMELRQKGIADKWITEALEETDIDETTDAVMWIHKKTRGQDIAALDEKQKRKIYAFLQRKGYRWHTISEAFAIAEEGEE